MFSIKRKVLKRIVFCVMLLFVTSFYWHRTKREVVTEIQDDFVKKKKLILFWTKFWTWNYPFGDGDKPFSNCRYSNCHMTFNRSLVNVEDFDAVMFHGSVYDKAVHGEPPFRKPHQRYIYFNTEAPPNKFSYNPDLTLFDSFYNWTMTYRYDSDVFLRYGSYARWKTMSLPPSWESVDRKTNLVAWFVSHCKTSSRREALVKEMQKYIPVDVYGKCGNLSCARVGYMSSSQCYEMLENTYKFYLSFENSLCEDYFTEKLYYILGHNIVPIVYAGNKDFIDAPPSSVINVKDFESVESLTDYLKFLDSNTEAYLKYFDWMEEYTITNNAPMCDLCHNLNKPVETKIYKDLHSWVWGTERHPKCLFNDTLPWIMQNLS